MLKAVFFDAAGTLIGARRPIGESYARVARDFGANVTAEAVGAGFRRAFGGAPGLAFGPGHSADQLRRLERRWWYERVAESFAGLHQFADFDAYFDCLFAYFGEPANWFAYDDVVPALEQIQAAGLRQAVISNFDARLYRLLAGLNLARFFDSVTISSEAGYAKPAPELFEFALHRMGIEPHQALHVGDSAHLDVAGAQAAGIEAVLIHRPHEGGHRPDPAHHPVVSSFDEIVALVKQRL